MTAAIETALQAMAVRRRRVAGVQAAVTGAAAVGLWLLGAILIDRWRPTPGGARQMTVAVAAGLTAWTAWRVGRAVLRRRVDLPAAAATAEALDAAWQERLSTLVTQAALPAGRRGSAAMLRATADAVEAELCERPPAARVTFAPVRPAGVLLAAVLALWLAACLVPWVDVPRLLARQFRPRAGLPPVTSLRIDVRPHARTVEQGQNLSITADVDGGDATPQLWTGPDVQHLSPVVMDRSYGRRFTATLLSLQDDFVYRVTAGDARTGPTAVRVLRRPGVSRVDVTLTPPGGAAVTIDESDGRLEGSRGTRVAVVFRVTEPVRAATLHVGDRTIAAAADADGRSWRAEFAIEQTAAWSIDLLGRRDVRGTGPAGMRILVATPVAPGEG